MPFFGLQMAKIGISALRLSLHFGGIYAITADMKKLGETLANLNRKMLHYENHGGVTTK